MSRKDIQNLMKKHAKGTGRTVKQILAAIRRGESKGTCEEAEIGMLDELLRHKDIQNPKSRLKIRVTSSSVYQVSIDRGEGLAPYEHPYVSNLEPTEAAKDACEFYGIKGVFVEARYKDHGATVFRRVPATKKNIDQAAFVIGV